VPEGLEWVVLRCLEKNRDARFSSIAELAAALAPFGGPGAARSAERIARVLGGIVSGAYSVPTSGLVPSGGATDGNFGASTETKKSRGALLIAIPLGVLAIGAVAFIALHKHTTEPSAEPTVSAQVAAPASAGLPVSAPSSTPEVAPVAAPASAAPDVGTPPVATQSARPIPVKGKPAPKAKPAVGAKPTSAAPTVDPLDGRQ
jgi:hypothetical protein